MRHFALSRSCPSILLLLSKSNGLLDSPQKLGVECFVGLVRRQIETVETSMRLGQLTLLA